MTVPASLIHSIQTLQVGLKGFRDKGELADETAAYSVLRSVLHQLRDRLTLEEAVDLRRTATPRLGGLFFEVGATIASCSAIDAEQQLRGRCGNTKQCRRKMASRFIQSGETAIAVCNHTNGSLAHARLADGIPWLSTRRPQSCPWAAGGRRWHSRTRVLVGCPALLK